jgi:single-strand DNA-binding protein
MAKSINQVIIMGRLTRDPEMRTTPSGKSVTSFSLAVDRQGAEDQTDFLKLQLGKSWANSSINT